MKKLFSVILISAMLIFPASAASQNWYFKHSTNHIQPSCDTVQSEITKHGGYYCDKNHSGWDDTDRVIYLTFDAGYENGNVEKILDVMEEKNVKGTFFILEHMTRDFPDLVKRMDSEGHFVCNHTATHKNMANVTDKNEFMAEINRLEDDCEKIGVNCRKFYRPPEGAYSLENLQWANEAGYKTIFWSFAYADWDNNSQMSPETAKAKILAETHNGEIILLHPTSATNATILGDLIDSWRDMGFRFALPDELK